MINSRFQQVIIIGCGKISVTVLKYVASLREKYGFALTFIQHETQELTAIRKVCGENELPFLAIPDKGELTEVLLSYQEETLIISAGNYYLFPKSFLERENISVINFHNALLPKYPGRNAPSWAIYYDEKESGATWHKVTEGVDSGGIIWQRACEITPDMKAYELTAKIMELAQEGLESFLEELLQGEVAAKEQSPEPDRRMYYAKDIPADGIVKITDGGAHIYRTLRAMDYGKMGPFPAPVLQLADGGTVEVVRYKKVSREGYDHGDAAKNMIPVSLDDGTIILLKYKER